MISRRRFIQASAGTLAFLAARKRGYSFQQSPTLTKFPLNWPLQGLGPSGIPVASPDPTPYMWGSTPVTHYTIDVKAYSQVLHPMLPATPLWGYGQNNLHRHLGGVIVVQKNQAIQVRVNNLLNGPHPVAAYIDRSARFPDCAVYPDTRIAVHLHGGYPPWTCDGTPDGWYGPAGGWAGGNYAPWPNQMAGNGTSPQQNSQGFSEYYWTNQQTARLLWYHDHAHDQTRTSAYAGLATAYVIRDDIENALVRIGAISSREVPLVFQDKVFNDGVSGPRGSLWYPSLYESDVLPSGRWAVDPAPPVPLLPMPIPSCVPEFYGDTILCNGTAYPTLNVAPRRYRFRILNAFQAKFMNVNFIVLPSGVSEVPVVVNDKPPIDPVTLLPILHKIPDPNLTALKIVQIATEGGLLKAPALFNQAGKVVPIGFDPITGNVSRYNLVLGPAERADILVDFSSVPSGSTVMMYTDAPSPFPGGDPRNDYFVGMENFTTTSNAYGLSGGAAPPLPGMGPDSRSLLRIVVGGTGPADMAETTMLATLSKYMAATFTTLSPTGAATTELSLNEQFDEYGRLIQKLGTVTPGVLGGLATSNPLFYNDALTADEVYNKGEIRKWRIWNLTGDTHPIHFHLVNVQIIRRELFDGITPDPSLITGPAPVCFPADPVNLPGVDKNEVGWKETVRINPLEVVTVIMKFDLPTLPAAMQVPLSTGHAIQTGHEYVWHCHILEHEEHDMMRAFIVKP